LCATLVDHTHIGKCIGVAGEMLRFVSYKSGLAPAKSTRHAFFRCRDYVFSTRQLVHTAIGKCAWMKSGDVDNLRSAMIIGNFNIRTWSEPSWLNTRNPNPNCDCCLSGLPA
jgi:hypothetical protein